MLEVWDLYIGPFMFSGGVPLLHGGCFGSGTSKTKDLSRPLEDRCRYFRLATWQLVVQPKAYVLEWTGPCFVLQA